jgi:hypothetical protein
MYMTIGGKVSDMFWLLAENTNYNGYVPSDIGVGGGDCVEFVVDIETGQIKNWKPLTVADIQSAIDTK